MPNPHPDAVPLSHRHELANASIAAKHEVRAQRQALVDARPIGPPRRRRRESTPRSPHWSAHSGRGDRARMV